MSYGIKKLFIDLINEYFENEFTSKLLCCGCPITFILNLRSLFASILMSVLSAQINLNVASYSSSSSGDFKFNEILVDSPALSGFSIFLLMLKKWLFYSKHLIITIPTFQSCSPVFWITHDLINICALSTIYK